ncbi:pyruvate:ferredoxin (flavodoxin) oxidoreductase [Photobacterium sp. SDRW27]|uniref:pyruvate:ferredoxin (flavodoxin) oxidoreductase n=1 Tax=Photobacterium obscurum TaxID=2829490 RepID=UPI002242E350|nr:pyruvate:ferredoxin (flavodoxin) oxidoreductase [Photobacterium obscurum]MCW8329107.1 pyruvate:ferredoxin (flavodoxin) oxidoreductase [Photobacterium obscurum]
MTNLNREKSASLQCETDIRIVDGNEAAASVAYRCNDVIGIYPITPSSAMSEHCEEWSNNKQPNCRGVVPSIYEMQSEGGAAGLLHGALSAGSLATSFTSSQGLLLMIPNMYKIAGELTPFVLHVAARTVATHALSIFGDHSDVMAVRQTGFAILASNSVQQAHDFALIAQAATLKSRIPFVHFFDGFRTSHELNHIDYLHDDILKQMINPQLVDQSYARRLTPDAPMLRGSSQNPDTYFQAREAVNTYYDSCPDAVIEAMDKFTQLTGRQYQPFEYFGDEAATHLIVIMGSACSTVKKTVSALQKQGEKVGVLCVHLFRPFAIEHCIKSIPDSVKTIAVLDRTKEPGAIGEPLYLDIVAAISHSWNMYYDTAMPRVFGGRYGLSSKELTPQHAEAVFSSLITNSLSHNFTVGIKDDVTRLSLPPLPTKSLVKDTFNLNAMFFGLGSDGTVGANKNTIKIVGNNSSWFTQGYFVYDSKKSGGMTTSHLRFDDAPIDAPYLIEGADFLGCHQFSLLKNNDVLSFAKQGATVLFNSTYSASELWHQLGYREQQHIIKKGLKVYTIDASKLANEKGIKGRINNIMQRAFFLLTDLMDSGKALELQNQAIIKTYQNKGKAVLCSNLAAVKGTDAKLHPVAIEATSLKAPIIVPAVSSKAPEFVQKVTAELMHGRGDLLPVSAFPVDGAWPTATSKWEKRDIASSVPQWNEEACTQCNTCSLVCPHSAIRAKMVSNKLDLDDAPCSFKTTDYKLRDFQGEKYTLQISPQDCTGCQLCVEMCPAKSEGEQTQSALAMVARDNIPSEQQENFEYFTQLPELEPIDIKRIDARSSQLLEPLLEFSGACSGCGETPYIKLLTQLYGDHMLIANATGCSSIYGGNLPTTPYAQNANGQGPAWANSLFEDNAEFGLGMRMAVDSDKVIALHLLEKEKSEIPEILYKDLVELASDSSTKGISAQRENVKQLKLMVSEAHPLQQHADALVAKSVWILGGDGWAFDIGFGGLDHVLASDKNVNIVVLNNQVYANTGGQQSKATPTGAIAKFASEGKPNAGKDLGITAMINGNAYVATVALGANMNQCLKAIQEAEAYPGPSLIIAYASCITHGINMSKGIEQQKLLVESGLWPLYRFDPRRKNKGKAALQLDSRPAKHPISDFVGQQNRFKQLSARDHQSYLERIDSLQAQAEHKQSLLDQLADWK